MTLPDIGLHEILVLAVVATVAYLALSLLRLGRVSRRKKPAARAEPAAAQDEASAKTQVEVEAQTQSGADTYSAPRVVAAAPLAAADAASAAQAVTPARGRKWLPTWVRADDEDAAESAASSSPAQFGEQLFRSSVDAELQHLRSDVASLREELKLLKTARRVSPQYNEAMLLAQRGMDAQGIADQCGISVGEAELVLALSRNKQEYDDYGEDDTRRSAG